MHATVSQSRSTHGSRARTCLCRRAARPRLLVSVKSMAEVTVSLRTISEHMVEQKMKAPCAAAAAKAAGKSTLETLYGTSVKFHSYQPGPGQPESMQLADADAVQHGAVLTYTTELPPGLLNQVLQLVADQKRYQEEQQQMKAQLQQQGSQLHILMERELLALVSKYSSRFLRAATQEFKKKDTIKTLIETKPQLASAVDAVLRSVGSPLTAVQFAGGLDDTYVQRNKLQHLNTDQQLEAEFFNMRKAGVVELLKAKMPLECLIVEHFEEFLKLVPK